MSPRHPSGPSRVRCATMERGISVRGVNPSECGGELRRPGRGRSCVAEALVIRSKVRSGAGGLRAARRAHLGPTVTVALKRQLPPGRRRDGAGPRWSCRHRRHVVGRLDGGAAALGSSPLAGRPPAAALSGLDRCCHNVAPLGGGGGGFLGWNLIGSFNINRGG